MLKLNSLDIEEVKKDQNSSLFLISHLFSGMGVTLGNFLRRNLLSNLGGIAPFAVRISCKEESDSSKEEDRFIKTKLSPLEGSSENAYQIVIKIRDIVFGSDTTVEDGKEFFTNLRVKNDSDEEVVVSARDFDVLEGISIKNPELYITTLAPKAFLEINLYLKKSVGYFRSEDQKDIFLSIPKPENSIVLDSDYSPIRGGTVNFHVEEIITNLSEKEEKLSLEISTNGMLSPLEALREVVSLSIDVFKNIGSKL
jgi:DNA-directed RNA polymerase subunit alpha